MIYTVTLNPSIDYLVFPRSFQPGKIIRYGAGSYGPGGKGVNVSRMLSALGMENTALGIAAGFTGRELARLLEEAGSRTDFLFLEQGHSRINFEICALEGPEEQRETAVNGEGPEMPPGTLERLLEKLSPLRDGDALVMAGSVPASLPRNVYALLLDRVKDRDLLTVVDAAGETLLSALPYRPFLIKPNLEELEELFGFEVRDMEAVKECAALLREKGARNVIVSMGGKGAMLDCEDGRQLFCRAVKGETVSTVGAGDSMVAGFLYGYRLHGTPEGALAWGAAAGAATAFSRGIAAGDKVKELYPKVGSVYPV